MARRSKEDIDNDCEEKILLEQAIERLKWYKTQLKFQQALNDELKAQLEPLKASLASSANQEVCHVDYSMQLSLLVVVVPMIMPIARSLKIELLQHIIKLCWEENLARNQDN